MFWNEDKHKQEYVIPDDIVDMVYSISGKTMPLEHIHALNQALIQALPWISEEEQLAIHPIHIPESGNGWERPLEGITYLSRRQKMQLRVPKHRIEDAKKLCGQCINLDGHEIQVGDATTKKLSDLSTMFSRFVVAEQDMSEDDFLQWAFTELRNLDVRVRKMMAGKERKVNLPDSHITTRSLMLAELQPEEAVRLQEHGIGPHRKLGCGIFVPQKGIDAVEPAK